MNITGVTINSVYCASSGRSGRRRLLLTPAQINFARAFFARVYFCGARSKVMMTDMQIEWNDTNVNTVNYMSKYQIIVIKHQLATAAYQKPLLLHITNISHVN